jgi:hypothetical protein
MKKVLLAFVFALPFLFVSPIHGQSSESLKTIMANLWVKKYKKLKNDLEEKATYAKGLKNVKEADLEELESAYNQTSKKLETWLDDVVASIGTNQKEALVLISEGKISQELKNELLEIFTFYSNEFVTRYEDITGDRGRSLLTHSKLMEDGQPCGTMTEVEKEKVDKEFLLAFFKKPLTPSNWKSLN